MSSISNKLNISSAGITISCDRGDLETVSILQEFYPVHSNRIGTQHTLSIRNVPEVLCRFRGLTIDNLDTAPLSIQNFYMKEITARETMQKLLAYGHTENPVVNNHLTLMPHQQLGREIAKVRNRYCFFLDTRTGKTPLSLSIIWDDVMNHPTHKWLIVCPLILIENAWLEDIKKFTPELTAINCHASTKAKRLEAMKQSANIYITNIESFATYKEEFEKIDFYGCFVDESSCMRSNKSKQTKALVDFAQRMKSFYLLSGRPSPNGLWELYPQLKAVDMYSVPASYTKFKERYFVNISYNPQFEKLSPNPATIDELREVVARYAIYIDQSDVLTLAGRTFNTVYLDMPAALKKSYNKLKRDLYIDTAEKQITTQSAGAMCNKLRQVASGFVIDSEVVKTNKFYDENNKEIYLLDTYRFDALAKLLKEIGNEQVIIWCSYRYEFEYIKNMLGNNCSMIYGAVSSQDKTIAIEQFKSGKVQYLIAHPASAKFGLTLTNSHTAVYFSLTFSYEDWKQSSERIYGRIESQPEHCNYYVLLAKGAIDDKIYNEVLTGKHTANMSLLNHLKGRDV